MVRVPVHQKRRLNNQKPPQRLCTFGQCVERATCRLSWKYGWDQDACERHAKEWLTFHRIKPSDKNPIVERVPLDGTTRTDDYWVRERERRIAALRKRDPRQRNAF